MITKKRQPLTLAFRNAIFRQGRLNLTVRQGDRWLGKTGPVELANASGKKVVGQGRIIDTVYVESYQAMKDRESTLLSLEHDPACRQWYGLTRAMREAYPDFKVEEGVTLVLFMVQELDYRRAQFEEEEITPGLLDKIAAQEAEVGPRLMTAADIASFPTPGK